MSWLRKKAEQAAIDATGYFFEGALPDFEGPQDEIKPIADAIEMVALEFATRAVKQATDGDDDVDKLDQAAFIAAMLIKADKVSQ